MKRAPRGPFSYLLERACGRALWGSNRGRRRRPTGVVAQRRRGASAPSHPSLSARYESRRESRRLFSLSYAARTGSPIANPPSFN
jgi:hypothetical protein